jgi:hypothetical protein
MKRFFSSLALVVCIIMLSVGLSYAADATENSMEFSATTSLVSKYVGSLTAATFYDKPALQGQFTATHKPTGLYASVWASVADNFNRNKGTELDFPMIGMIQRWKGFTFDLCGSYYNLMPIGHTGKEDYYGIALRVEYPKMTGIVPYTNFEYYISSGSSSLNGLAYRMGAYRYWWGAFKTDLAIFGHGEAFGTREELMSAVRLSLSYSYLLKKNLYFIPEVSGQKRLGYKPVNGGLTEDVVQGGVNLAYKFW